MCIFYRDPKGFRRERHDSCVYQSVCVRDGDLDRNVSRRLWKNGGNRCTVVRDAGSKFRRKTERREERREKRMKGDAGSDERELKHPRFHSMRRRRLRFCHICPHLQQSATPDSERTEEREEKFLMFSFPNFMPPFCALLLSILITMHRMNV